MRGYVATRLLLAIPTIFLITVLVFLAMNILPGDPLVAMFGFEGFAKLSPHDRQRIMEQLGLADPLWKQYVHWMQDIATGNLGESFFKGEPVDQRQLVLPVATTIFAGHMW